MDPRVRAWYERHPGPTGRASMDDPESRVVDLGGEDGLNLWLTPPGWVLRVHKPFVGRGRLLTVQRIRDWLFRHRLRMPRPVRWSGAWGVRCTSTSPG
jgi:hypothetical protein